MIWHFSLDYRLVTSSITLQLKKDASKQLDIENMYYVERLFFFVYMLSSFCIPFFFYFMHSINDKTVYIIIMWFSFTILWPFNICSVSKLQNPIILKKGQSVDSFICISRSFGLLISFLGSEICICAIWILYKHNQDNLTDSDSVLFTTKISSITLSILMIVTWFKSINLKPFLLDPEKYPLKSDDNFFNTDNQSSIIEPTEEKEDF